MLITLLSAVLLICLAVLAHIDARTYRLPDVITLPLIPAGLLANILLFDTLWPSLIGAALGYLGLVGLELAYKRLRGRDGLGRGDAKLLAAGGAWCGALALPFILLVASFAALLFVLTMSVIQGRKPSGTTMLAFGPWLAFGIGLVWMLKAWWPETGLLF